MKKIYLFLLLVLCAFKSELYAQVSNYTFSQSIGTYTPITGGTVLGNATSDDQYFVNPAVPLGGTTNNGVGFPIGFNFSFNGSVFDRVGINNNGWITLGQSSLTPSVNMATSSAYTVLSSTTLTTPPQLRSRIAAMGRDLQAQAGAEIRIETIGTAPNRTFVVQWTNYRKYLNTGDNFNFQIRLIETTNAVNIVYGTVVFNATANTADVGLGGNTPADFNNRTTTTNWNASTAGTANTNRMAMQNTVTAPVAGTTFTWTLPVACSGTPDPGNTISSANPACNGVSFLLSLQNNPVVSGLSYQWQSSADGTTFVNIPAANGSTYTVSQTAATYYRAIVTCGAVSANSTPVQVTMDIPTNCYCTPASTNCTDGDVISNVTISTLNNNSACSTNGYTNYTITVPVANLIQASNTMSVTVGDGGTEYVGVWIDYNVDGIFSASEFTALGSGNNVTITGTINVPLTATQGTTRMRVRTRFNTALTGADACLSYVYGETEDYAVNIVPCVQGAITTHPVNRTAGCSGTTTFSATATGSALTYQWEYKAPGSSSWLNVINGGNYSGATTSTLTVSNIPSTFNGYQYRVVYSGPCTASDHSNAATLTVGPLVGTVTPVAGNICSGTILPLSITNTATQNNSSFCSGTIAVAVPDNSVAGTTHSIPVTIPSGSVISGLSVTINMAHTYIGDMVFVLKAPNGAILNLDYYLSGTGGTGASTGFVNTTFSSASTTFISTGVNPYTGTYRADGASPAAAPASGPTGFLPTVGTFAGLYSVPNGNWTLAMYDGFNGDVGVLTSWCLNFTYGAPATGTWTGTGLFSDAAATIPYVAGTPTNTVYVNPSATSTYSVSVANSICTAAPVDITVTVSNTLADVMVNNRDSVCAGGNKTLTVSATSGNIQTTQWQVSTNNGASFANITDGGVYSGSSSTALTLTGVPESYNGYQYRAIVTNACNSITTTADTLTVNSTSMVSLTAAPFTSVLPGVNTILTATVTPNPAATFTWYNNGVQISNTGSSINVDVDGIGDYYVVSTDIFGCTATSNTITITDSASSIVFIYPSPTTGRFQVRNQGDRNMTVRMLNVYDSKGARVYSKSYPVSMPFERMDVDMTKHGKGVYMVELVNSNGERLKAGRVVIL